MASETSRDIDTLYAVPLAEFTRRRNELATRLREAGRRDEAAAVRRLKRPSVPVWAINVLAREHVDAVRAFVDATDRLRHAQVGDRQAMADATQAQRRALQSLMRWTELILRRGGFSPTAPTLQRISNTLLGAATDRDARRALLDGRLTEERQAPGFEALAAAPTAHAPESRTKLPTPRDGAPSGKARTGGTGDRRSRARALEERRAQAALEVRRAAQARVDDLAAKARALEEEAAAREREAAEAAHAVTELQQQLRQAGARARERRRAAGKAATAAKRARRDSARVADELREIGREAVARGRNGPRS